MRGSLAGCARVSRPRTLRDRTQVTGDLRSAVSADQSDLSVDRCPETCAERNGDRDEHSGEVGHKHFQQPSAYRFESVHSCSCYSYRTAAIRALGAAPRATSARVAQGGRAQLLPDVAAWFCFESSVAVHIFLKLALLAGTVGLAVDARLRLVHTLDARKLRALAFHITSVTVLAVLFLLVGASLRTRA